MEIVCHRGANEYAPENTYASSVRCIDWGADYLEVDVNTSRDGVPFLFHGPDLARTTNGEGLIYECESHDLDQLDCGSWFDDTFAMERIPRLEPFLEWVDHRIKLFFDVKWADLAGLRKLIYQHKIENECFFWFGRDKFAHQLHQLDPTLALKINVEKPTDVELAHNIYGASIVEFSLENATADMIDACKTYNIKSMILHPKNDPDTFKQILLSGADMINLDHADHFLKVQRELHL